MTITEKTAYLKGLLEGMAIDQTTNEGKLLAAIIDTLDDIALAVADLDDEVGAINDEMDMMEESLDAIDEALDDVEDALDAIDEDLDDMDDELEELFDLILTADMFPRSKPDPDCFLTAASKLGCAPEECIVFEDSLHGLQAGRSAGMHVVALATTLTAERIAPLADEVWDDFTDK